jgi:starch synthase
MAVKLPSVLFVTSEMAPWVKTGGLGDVAAALPASLRQAGVDIRVLIPCYPALGRLSRRPDRGGTARPAPALPAARLLAAHSDGLPLLLLDCPALFDRPGNPYLDSKGQDQPDNARRFGLLSRVAARLGQPGSPLGWQPDVVHVNDWQGGLAPAFLHYEGGAASVITVHNIAFQGCFGHDMLAALGLPGHAWRFDGVEYHNQLSFLKAGLQFATRCPPSAPPMPGRSRTSDFGYGLAPLLRHRAGALRGILNGIDTTLWNPATDTALAPPTRQTGPPPSARTRPPCRRRWGSRSPIDRPLFGVISRLTHQKGLDLLLPSPMACRPAGPAGRARQRRQGHGGRLPDPGRNAFPGTSPCRSASTRPSPTASRPGPTAS